MAHTGTLVGGFAPGAWCPGEFGLMAVGVRPLLQTVQGLEDRRDTLLSLQRSAPALERQLNQAETELRIAEEKQALLLSLLAGRDKVQTFLALLNQQAVASGVQMQRYEPLKTPPLPPGQPRRNNNRSNGMQKAEQPQDPLQELGYRKSSVALEVTGSFGGLQSFLQRMEALELLVESSDLEVKASVSRDADREAKAPPESRTELTLQLSFYDPRKDDVDFDHSREQPPN